MKIAVFQGPQQAADPPSHLALLAECAERARARGARLLIAPEMFLTGYRIGDDAIRSLAEPADGAAAQRIATIARQTGMALLYGYAERDGDAIYNAAQLIDRDGRRLANHRKTHLFGDVDRFAFTAGSAPTLTELDGLRLGILICYDLEFPENARMLALAGADLIAVPTALMQPYRFVASTLVPARAFENQVFVAYANRCDTERDFDYLGLSCIIAPDGTELARAGGAEALLVAELDARRQLASRRLNPYLHDRRPALYGALAEPPHTERLHAAALHAESSQVESSLAESARAEAARVEPLQAQSPKAAPPPTQSPRTARPLTESPTAEPPSLEPPSPQPAAGARRSTR